MFYIILRFTFIRRAGLLALVPLLAALAIAAFGFRQPVAADLAATETLYLPSTAGRHVYLTAANHYPNAAKTACAPGYHMASLWELYDISNLTYDTAHPLAYTKDDSGSGPPAGWYGWVRTGNDSSGSTTTGMGNCLNWTSIDPANYGVSVRLSTAWETAPGDIGPWDATSFTCSSIGPVWCVGEFHQIYLPITLR